MKIVKRYIIYWFCDGTEEIYDNQNEYSGRINTLENQGYEKGIDFDIEIVSDLL